MDILMPASSYQGSDHPSIDLRLVGLGIFRGYGSNWVKPFRLHGCFNVDSDWESLTDHILQVGGAILMEAEIFDAISRFSKLSAITWLPIIGKLYEEFMPIDSILEEHSKEFRLLYFQLVAFNDFLKEKEGVKVWCSSWKSGSCLSSNSFDNGESSESTTQEARSKNPSSKKISTMRENLKELFASTDAIHYDIALRRDLAVYLTYWLAHIFYSWYVYHCPSFHRLGAAQDDDPFMIRLAKGKPVSESLLSARLRIRQFRDVEMGQSSVKLSSGLRKKAFDFGVSRDSTKAGSGRHYSLTNAEKAWFFNIRVGTMVYHRHLFVDIQSYVPSRFALQLSVSQGVVGVPSSKVKRFGDLQDGRNAWAFYSAKDTTAMISYPELPTFRTAGFTKWFVESFSANRGLSKKELDVKQSSGKGLGKSDGVRREEVLAFILGEKHKIGFLDDRDVIRSGVAQEIPGEVLEQLTEEEAEVVAWIQAKRAKASMESTGKSRPSNEDFSKRPDFDGGAGTSSKSSRRSKRRRGQHRNKRRHEDSPNLEVPSTIAEEASGDDDEPLEKRSRGEKISSDKDNGLVMPEVSADEAVTDPVVASEEKPRDSKVDPESPPADLLEDSDDFEPTMDATFDDVSDELMEAESIPPEKFLSFSEPEKGVPAADPGVGAFSTSFDEAEASPHADVSSPAASIGKSFLITLPTVHDMGSRPMEHGESSSEPSRQFARKVGLDITNAKAFVDEVIALGNKWIETRCFPNGDFFNEMFLKPSGKVKSELDEISRTQKQFVRERNVTKLAIIELTQDQHRLDREVIEARQRLELLEEQAAAKWTAILKARNREMTLIRQVEKAENNLRRKTQEFEQWQILWEELSRDEDGSR
ncbi:hypothetical protein AAC387_Pa02g2167 [Persea americana]